MNADVTTVDMLREIKREHLCAVNCLNFVGAVSDFRSVDFAEDFAAFGFKNFNFARIALSIRESNGIGLRARTLFIAQAIGNFAGESFDKTFYCFFVP